jgi:succinyl-CoA synthetase beta subunit
VQEIGMKKPIDMRLQGTNVIQAKELIENSGLRIVMADDLDDAAKKVCNL